jgi:hypothetical protein
MHSRGTTREQHDDHDLWQSPYVARVRVRGPVAFLQCLLRSPRDNSPMVQHISLSLPTTTTNYYIHGLHGTTHDSNNRTEGVVNGQWNAC